MKVVILAGGYGTRLSEETDIIPKPMVEVDNKPILWHIMKIYSHYGFHEFVILLGYKGYVIKEYFANYFLHQNVVTIDLSTNRREFHDNVGEPWKVTLVDTGRDTMTGGRILRAKPFVGDAPFMLTYGDTLMDIDVGALVDFHKSHGKIATMTVSEPPGQYGVVQFSDKGQIDTFAEKPPGARGWVNAGFLVCEPKVFDYIDGDDMVFERRPIERMVADGEIMAHPHQGFYKCMDTLRDKMQLNQLCEQNQAVWKVWE